VLLARVRALDIDIRAGRSSGLGTSSSWLGGETISRFECSGTLAQIPFRGAESGLSGVAGQGMAIYLTAHTARSKATMG
jgi:hypothetical protein